MAALVWHYTIVEYLERIVESGAIGTRQESYYHAGPIISIIGTLRAASAVASLAVWMLARSREMEFQSCIRPAPPRRFPNSFGRFVSRVRAGLLGAAMAGELGISSATAHRLVRAVA